MESGTHHEPTGMAHSSVRFRPSTWQEKVLDKYYRSRTGWTDGTTQFHELVAEALPGNCRILEIGAGPGSRTTQFLSTLGVVTGLDIDPDVAKNPYCDSAIVYDGVHIPCEDGSFDAAVSVDDDRDGSVFGGIERLGPV